MTTLERKLIEEFQQCLDLLTEQGMLIDSNPLVSRASSAGTGLSWSRASGLSYLFSEYASIEQYIEILNRRDFSFCLFDGGVVQVNYFLKGDEIISHRLCYVPCPFSYSPEEWDGVSLGDVPLLMDSSDFIKNARLASPIRFDFDAEFSDERHAHAHLSLNKSSCRVPAYGPVSMGHFFRFILRYFYEPQFAGGDGWSDIRPRLHCRTLSHPAPHELHIETAVGY